MRNTLLIALLALPAASLWAQDAVVKPRMTVTRTDKKKSRSEDPAARPQQPKPKSSPIPPALDRLSAKVESRTGSLSGVVLDRFFDNTGVGGDIPAVKVTDSRWRGAPKLPAPSPLHQQVPREKARGIAPTPHRSVASKTPPPPPTVDFSRQYAASFPSPAHWSESIVRALFIAPLPRKGGPQYAADPVAVEYRLDEQGQIIGVNVPSHAYSEEREFAGGLVVKNTIRREGSVVEVSTDYDRRGRAIGKTSSGDTSVLLTPLPFAPVVASLVLDWQISREDRLRIQEDTRPRDFHSPFWDGSALDMSRGYTDPDLPKTWKKHPILGVKRPHEGIDIPRAEGTKVYPSRRGLVVAVGWAEGYGLRVKVQHYKDNRPDGSPEEATLYGHLSKASVKKGQWVTPGKDILGLVGSTGLSTGPHLHFEVHTAEGKAIDPTEKLAPALPRPGGTRAVLDPKLARVYPQ